MEKLKSIEQFEQMKNNGKHIFVFCADWCPDCRFVEMYLPDIEDEYEEYQFVLVDQDEFSDLCKELDIFGIPSFVAFNEGVVLGRFVSKDRKTKEEVEFFIDGLEVS